MTRLTLFPKTVTYYSVTFTRTKGVPTIALGVALTFSGSTQPTTGKDLETLPQGREDRGTIKVYSDIQLNISAEGTSNPGDYVVHSNKKWEVIAELDYDNNLIPHYKYIAELREAA